MPVSRRAEAVSTLIRLGWSPPRLDGEKSLKLLDTIAHAQGTLELSPSERRLLQALANGETTVSFAEKRNLSKETTKAQAKEIRRKMGVKTMTQAVAWAVDESLVEFRPPSA